MKILSRQAIEESTANPKEGALGFVMDVELDKAMNTALRPIAARLRQHKAEEARLLAICDRWTPDALQAKLDAIASRAQAGEEEAILAIENGAIPTRIAYNDMYARAYAALEHFRLNNRGIFAEAAALIRGPMSRVAERGQEILDQTCSNFGIPHFQLNGVTNYIAYVCGQLEKAGQGLSHTLDGFWLRFK
jgi:hypothetical protein